MHTRHRIQNFVPWHHDSLAAPAPRAAIVAMLRDKHDGPIEGDLGVLTVGSFNQSIDEAVEAGLIRFVAHDYLPDGYATVEDPS